jgi:acyl-CoA reductase-like NAD-dependent aldehyde dehydrogenase
MRTYLRGRVCHIIVPKDELTRYLRFPPGVLNCVPALGAVGGAALASHPDVDKV